MFKEIITPRFSDTDALGHINNTLVPVWFEAARNPIFKLFNPELNVKQWNLILAKIEVEFHSQLFFEFAIEVRTYISRIGGSSFSVYQELWQQDQRCASGTAVMVYFCYQQQKSMLLDDRIKADLQQHLFTQ